MSNQERSIRTLRATARAIKAIAAEKGLTVADIITDALQVILNDSVGLQLIEPKKDRQTWYVITSEVYKESFAGSQTVSHKQQVIRHQIRRKFLPLPQVDGLPRENPHDVQDEYTIYFDVDERLYNNITKLADFFQLKVDDVVLQALERYLAKYNSAKAAKPEASAVNATKLQKMVERNDQARELSGKSAANKGYAFLNQELNHARSLTDG